MTRLIIDEAVAQMVAEKRSAGYSWEVPERVLRQFAEHCRRSGVTSAALAKEVVDGFLYLSHYRSSTVRRNERVLHALGEWLRARGVGAYVCPVATKVAVRNPQPYIFTDDELRRFFEVVDSLPVSAQTNAYLADPVLFRMLYGTGVRVSEALGVTLGDIADDGSSVVVRCGKNGKERLVPLSPSLAGAVGRYMLDAHVDPDPSRYLFYARDPLKRMGTGQIYLRFRQHLAAAGIPHFKGGPCVHSFRHTFAVANLRKWARTGEDLTAKLPLLSAYMGHSSLNATHYYLRLTADMYPEVVERVQLRFGYVIPEGGREHGED